MRIKYQSVNKYILENYLYIALYTTLLYATLYWQTKHSTLYPHSSTCTSMYSVHTVAWWSGLILHSTFCIYKLMTCVYRNATIKTTITTESSTSHTEGICMYVYVHFNIHFIDLFIYLVLFHL